MMLRQVLLFVLTGAVLAFGCKNPSQPGGLNVPDRQGEGSGSGEGSSEDVEVEEEGDPLPAAVRIRQRGVRIAEGRTAVVLVGESEVELLDSRLTAVVLDEERNPIDVPVTWHSLDPEKVTIDQNGVLRAVSLGPVFVTASAGDVIAEQIPVYVVHPSQMPDFEEEGSGDEAEGGDTAAPAGEGESTPEEETP